MTVKEIRKNALNKYRSHKLNSWAIGIVCGLFCAAVVALNLLWPFFTLFTVPLLVLPFFFACSVMNAAFEEGADLSVNLFFKSFILFFKTPFNHSFNLVKSFLKSVIVFIAVMFLSSMVVYTIFQGLYGDTFIGLLEKFTNLAYSLNSNYEDIGIGDFVQNDEDEYAIGKYLCEDKNGNVFNEKLFLGFKKKFKEGENNDFNEKMIIGYISNRLP